MKKCCENCGNLIPLGEGDHTCGASEDGDPKAVIEDYAPSTDYMWCGGKQWEG